MIVIYTPEVTHRIKYTFDFVFSQHLGLAYELITNPEERITPNNVYISYAEHKHPAFFSVFQTALLLENRISPQKLFVSRESGMPVFFQTTDDFDLRFDFFSCIFYLLSRYEEYLPHEQDMHGRFMSSGSILANPVFDFAPVIEYWLNHFKEQLLQLDPNLQFRSYTFEHLHTFDIDNAFKYKGRNWLKHPPNLFHKECRNVLFYRHSDPYDTYDYIFNELEKYNSKAMFFFLMSDSSADDSKVAPSSKLLLNTIKKTQTKHHLIGIHPSYFSQESSIIQHEKNMLETASQSTINLSRQHFLRIRFPHYFNALIEAGIQHDYSMLYPDVVGFRAGYSRSFYFFDLLKNESTPLQFHPACWMDATYEYYQTKNIEEIEQKILQLVEQLQKINAKLVTLFHNDLLGMEKYRGLFSFFNRHTNLRG